jgi:Flp pilus assembly protein TadG
MIWKRAGNRPRKGTTIVEMAFVAIVFFMFLFGVLEYARFIFIQNMLDTAAREGARFAVVQTSSGVTTAQVQNYVDAYLAGQGTALSGYVKTTNITVFQASTTTGLDNSGGWTNAGPGQAIGVKISGTYTPLLPNFLFMGTTLSIQGTAVMYSETN